MTLLNSIHSHRAVTAVFHRLLFHRRQHLLQLSPSPFTNDLASFSSTHSKAKKSHKDDQQHHSSSIRSIRNLAVIAHIDAGKTTTTEYMLFISHRTHQLGRVDRGDTVTDYLAEERQRGITIVSGPACFEWRHHNINLLDTPGHVDFGAEVERSLSVVDSVLVILDASKGVQAQTRTVWRQADRHNLPRLVYANKMDRLINPATTSDSLDKCLTSLSSQFPRSSSSFCYIPLQLPVYSDQLIRSSKKADDSKQLIGLVDLVSMRMLLWPRSQTSPLSITEPRSIDLLHFTPSRQSTQNGGGGGGPTTELINAALTARLNLLDACAEFDESFADHFLSLTQPERLIPPDVVQDVVKHAVHANALIPVLVGSSRRGIGVDCLLDAIINYLPDPSHRPLPVEAVDLLGSSDRLAVSSNNKTVALVFKILFDQHLGAISLARLYSGSIAASSSLVNASRHSSTGKEKVTTVLQITGDHREPLQSPASAGSIVGLTGLDSTRSGDLLCSPELVTRSTSSVDGCDSDHDDVRHHLTSPDHPTPVVFAGLEPATRSAARLLDGALARMQREDPSLTAKFDSDTGQWILGGMGDLHLDVSMSRMRREHKVDAKLGRLMVAYKEFPNRAGLEVLGHGRVTGSIDGGGKERVVDVELLMQSINDNHLHSSKSVVPIKFAPGWDGSQDSHHHHHHHHHSSTPTPSGTHNHRLLVSIRDACLSSLESTGPLLRSPVVGVSVTINSIRLSNPTATSSLDNDQVSSLSHRPLPSRWSPGLAALAKSAATQALRNAIQLLGCSTDGESADWRLLEPMMQVEVRLPIDPGRADSISKFLGDLTNRRALIESVDSPSPTIESSLDHQHHVIRALAPLSELVGYAAAVRTLSSGRAELHLELANYHPVSIEHQEILLGRMRWMPLRKVK